LPAEYQRLYSGQREQSLQLYTLDGASIRKSSEKILQTPQLSLVEMAALTQDSTDALDFITGTAEWKPPLLAEYLQKDGWYNPEYDVLKGLASKKDAALFLWHLIVGNDKTRLKKYTRYYTNKRRLPIPDVMIDGVYFDAIVGTVEEDIVPLTDGTNFEPDKPVSGMEFYRWLLKALDNIEEIRPDIVVVNASDYPRHWKTLTQFIKSGIAGKIPDVILYVPKSFSETEKMKAQKLGIKGIFDSCDEDGMSFFRSIVNSPTGALSPDFEKADKARSAETDAVQNTETASISSSPPALRRVRQRLRQRLHSWCAQLFYTEAVLSWLLRTSLSAGSTAAASSCPQCASRPGYNKSYSMTRSVKG